MPRGATPLDFAYRVHTNVGHRCIGAKVNGKLVPLNQELKNGDVVEVMVTKTERGPSLDWLIPGYGLCQTSHAMGKIRQWFKKQERTVNIERGRQVFEREVRRLAVTLPNVEELARLFNCESYDDFLASIGSGVLTSHQIAQKLALEPEAEPDLSSFVNKVMPAERPNILGIQVWGVGDLLTRLGACCNPLPGDDIIGFITRSQEYYDI